MLTWLINNYNLGPLSKDEINDLYAKTTLAALSGRISELYGLELLERIILPEGEKPSGAAFNSPRSKYKVNLVKASRVINNGGKLASNS